MSHPLILRVHTEADGGWHVSVGEVGASVETGRIPADGCAAIVDGVASCLSTEHQSALMIPGDDAEVTAAEERAGRLLARVLEASPAVARAVARARGAAEARGQLLPLLVDAAEPGLRDLPWECLASDPGGLPLEGGAGAVVARIGHGGAVPTGTTLRPVLWCADEADGAVEELADAVRAACLQADLPAPQRPAEGAPAPGEAGLVFLVGHGESVARGLRVLGQEGGIAPGTLAHSLRPWLEGAPLVVLLICEGGLRHPLAPDGLVDRLLHAGVGAVLASEVRLYVPAAASLVSGLVPALARGQSVAEAVAAGRRAVRGLALPYPDARWWRLGLTVGHARALGWAASSEAIPAGWRPGPRARAVLARALAIGRVHQHGWLGLEHLALALAEDPPKDKVLRFVLAKWTKKLPELMYEPESDAVAAPVQSPRLLRLRSALPAGFDPDDLARALAASLPWGAQARLGLALRDDGGDLTLEEFDVMVDQLQVAAGEDDGATRDLDGPAVGLGGPWVGFEVVGGPEDGRQVVLAPGERLGRAYDPPQADHLLYGGQGGFDPYLSRRHLRVEEGGAVTVSRRGHWHFGRKVRKSPEGRLDLEAGDVLALTPVTWLVALSPDEARE